MYLTQVRYYSTWTSSARTTCKPVHHHYQYFVLFYFIYYNPFIRFDIQLQELKEKDHWWSCLYQWQQCIHMLPFLRLPRLSSPIKESPASCCPNLEATPVTVPAYQLPSAKLHGKRYVLPSLYATSLINFAFNLGTDIYNYFFYLVVEIYI